MHVSLVSPIGDFLFEFKHLTMTVTDPICED